MAWLEHLWRSDERESALHIFEKNFGLTPQELLELLSALEIKIENVRLQKALPAPQLDPKQIVKDAEELLREALNK